MNRIEPREPTVPTYRAAELAGCSYRQLDYWARIGLLVPSVPAKGSGSRRAFTASDVRTAWALAQVLPEQRRAVADALAAHPDADLLVIGGAHAWAVTDEVTLAEARGRVDYGGPLLGVLSMAAAPLLDPVE